MATVTSEILVLTLAGIKTNFEMAYHAAQEKAEWNWIATEVPTTLPIQEYGWLGRGAVMQQVNDRPIEQEISAKSYTLADIEYRGDMVVARTAIEDDQYGLINRNARALGGEPVRHWNELAYTGLANAFTSLCYDGFYFFSASHSEGISGTQSNITSSLLSDSALQAAEAAMMAFVDDKGKPMRVVPNTLVVGPSNARMASDLTNSDVIVHVPGDGAIGSGATAYTPANNYFKGKYRVIVNPYLVGSLANHWFLLDTSREVKPIVIQSRSDVPITFETDMLEPSALRLGKFHIGPRGRYVQGVGLWQLAYGSNA